jgi:hypothetical protein
MQLPGLFVVSGIILKYFVLEGAREQAPNMTPLTDLPEYDRPQSFAEPTESSASL